MILVRIRLARNERVTLAPIIKEYVTVHSNGSIELTKPLNFELNNEIHFSVQIDGPPKGLFHFRFFFNFKNYLLLSIYTNIYNIVY
uniref:Cadherin domain-containing protein n=1 Tax=Ascaris lumbricoides TaxID=6252 RepID=A0A0M3HM81_ASCLU